MHPWGGGEFGAALGTSRAGERSRGHPGDRHRGGAHTHPCSDGTTCQTSARPWRGTCRKGRPVLRKRLGGAGPPALGGGVKCEGRASVVNPGVSVTKRSFQH